MCAKEGSLIIIDEPENHLHKSILSRLWDAIERERDDCVFLYITHDLEFAKSRMQSQIIWVKEYISENCWEYELLEEIEASDSLKLEILGNRQHVLLVEGTQSHSIDKKLYSRLYPEYNVISMESCNAVAQAVKAYNRTETLHYMEVRGIIDRDRRSDDEVEKLKAQKIYTPQVAEVESFFLLPEVIEAVAIKQDKKNAEEIIDDTKKKVMDFLAVNKEKQALLFTKQRCINYMLQKANVGVPTIQLYRDVLDSMHNDLNAEAIYTQELEMIDSIIGNKNYMEALKIINDKGLLPYTALSNKFGWKKEYYIEYVLRILEIGDTTGQGLRTSIRRYIFD